MSINLNEVLITGGSGLVGSAFPDKCMKVSSKDADLRDFNQTLELFVSLKPKYVIHTAARVGGLFANMNAPAEFYRENILINTNVLEAARRTNVTRVLSFLSTCVFPDKIEYPLTEDKVHLGPPHESNAAYAYAKRMMDIQTRAYNKQYGRNDFCVIPCGIYGPRDNFSLSSGHVLPALVRKCIEAKESNSDFVCFGSGNPLREFIYSEDIAKACLRLLDVFDDKENPLIIVSNPNEVSIREVAEQITKILNFDGNLIFDTSKADGQFRKPSSNEKMLKYLPDFKFTDLETGLKNMISWYIENINLARR